MRVTDVTKRNAIQDNIQKNSEALQNIMVSVSSGKRIQKPSDDPIGAMTSQGYQTSINRASTIERNIAANRVWLEKSEQLVIDIGSMLQKSKELSLAAADGSASQEAREAVGREVTGILDSMIKLGNTKEGKLYFLSGTKTLTLPLIKNTALLDTKMIYRQNLLVSKNKIIPIKQDKALSDLQSGIMEINIVTEKKITTPDGEKKTVQEKSPVSINIDEEDSINIIIDKINEAFIARENYQPSNENPLGYVSKLTAQMDINNTLRLIPEEGIEIDVGNDTSGFLGKMNFESRAQMASSVKIKSFFTGNADQSYILRIIKDGKLGSAQYTVSDDNGKSWGRTELLKNKNELFNPEGAISQKVNLVLQHANEYDFKEGQEFHFPSNPYVVYEGNKQSKEVLIDSGIKIPLNITGHEVFFKTDDETVNVFDVLNTFKESAINDDQDNLLKIIPLIDKAIAQVLTLRSTIGIRIKTLGESTDRLGSLVYSKTKSLSEIQDLDIAKAMIELNSKELKNTASLDTGARLIQPTLLNFLN